MTQRTISITSILGVLIMTALSTPAQPQPGFPGGLQSLPLLTDAETRSISAENPTGERGRGGMAIPDPAEPPEEQAASARAADDLGQGWKVKPFLRVNAGKTATLMDVDGSGVIQHIWMVEGLKRDHVLRFYWDGEETPSVEVPVGDFFANCFGKRMEVISDAVIVEDGDSYNCFWHMPFRKSARIEIVNQSEKPIRKLYKFG